MVHWKGVWVYRGWQENVCSNPKPPSILKSELVPNFQSCLICVSCYKGME